MKKNLMTRKVAILNNLRREYYGYFDTDMARQYTPPEIKYALNDIIAPPHIEKLSRRNERIKSTLTAIVEAATREILQEAPPSVREYIYNIARIRLDDISMGARDNKLTVVAKYIFVKNVGTADIANITILFRDEFLAIDDVCILTEPYVRSYNFEHCFPNMLVAYITRCIERDFCRMVNALGASEWLDGCPCKYCKEEKEKKEMTTSEANYIYNVKMTSEMREACDKITEDARQQTYCKTVYKAYETYRLNAAYGTEALAVGAENKKLSVKEIVINEPTMIIFWEDGTKTVVKATDEAFDAEKGLAMAFAKKALGNNYAAGGRFKAKLKHAKWAPKPKKEKKKDAFSDENLRGDAKEVVEGTKKSTKEKPVTKTAWIKSMMEEGFTRAEATKTWEKKHQK